ncbi:hypothetical protein JCM8202_004883 [Rhodotorula sphaerocarpa]
MPPASMPTTWPQAGPSPSKRKRAKTKEGEEPEPEPEKRLRIFKRACPKATLKRAERVFAQRFFCVDRTRLSDSSEQFSVLGSTGNLYTVTIQHLPSCDCPDGRKGNHCKHLLFVFLKVLGVPMTTNLWYQAGLLTSELQAIFTLARPAPRNVLEERVRQAYEIATGKKKADEESAEGSGGRLVKKRIPEEGDSCPICYEDFEAGSETGLVFCLSISGCGNALHRECFNNWARTSNPNTCPMCREKWPKPGISETASTSANAAAGPAYSEDGYQNFAAHAGISTVRDTSSYYDGPRRGEPLWRRPYFGEPWYGDGWTGGSSSRSRKRRRYD